MSIRLEELPHLDEHGCNCGCKATSPQTDGSRVLQTGTWTCEAMMMAVSSYL